MKYKKIFILTSHFPPQKGGVETSIRMFLDWTENKENYSVTVVTYDNRRESGEFKDYWNKNKVIRINVPKEHLKYMISLKEITLMNILFTNPSVNTSIFYPKNKMLTRDVLTLPQDKTIILFSSALNDTKFADFIIDIAYKLLDLNDKYFFIFVGEGYLDKDVEKLAIRYPLDVKFINKSIDQSDLSDYFNAADIAIGTVDIDLSLIHISEPTRLGMISYAVFCLKKK